jgi:acetyl esterase/lipase
MTLRPSDIRTRLRRMCAVAIVAGAATAATGFPPAQAATASTGVTVLKDIAYAPPQPATSLGHLLDLYLPEHHGRRMPLVIWSHGSGWLAENGRVGADVVAAALNPHGFAVAGVAIRSSANAQFPGQLHDIKAAIRYLRANAERYHLDAGRFGIMGESSGGWTAAMAAVTGDVARWEGDVGVRGPSSRVQAAVPFYPPTDFLRMDAHMIDCPYFNDLFGLTACHSDPRSPESLLVGCQITTCPEAAQRANPIRYVSRRDPPFLIIHGTNDLLVPYHQSVLLYRALRRACGDVTFVTVPGGAHGAWEEWMSDPSSTAGSYATSSDDCHPQRVRQVDLSWQTVLRFFAGTLRADEH